MRSHFVSLINEITTSSNYQNSVFNTISTNTIKCRGLSECAAAQPLDTATQVEFERATNSAFMFYMTQNVLGIAVTYCCYILAAASLSQAVLGLLLKLQQTVCRRNRKKCSCCEALICLFTNLDSYLNPLSMTKAQVDKRIGQINMHLQELNARGARKDVEMEALVSTVARLHSRIAELEGFEATPQAVYYNPAPSPTGVTFSTHRTSRDATGTDMLELMTLLPKSDQPE